MNGNYIVRYNSYQLQSNAGFYTQLYDWLVIPPMPIAGYTIGYNLGTKQFTNSMVYPPHQGHGQGLGFYLAHLGGDGHRTTRELY